MEAWGAFCVTPKPHQGGLIMAAELKRISLAEQIATAEEECGGYFEAIQFVAAEHFARKRVALGFPLHGGKREQIPDEWWHPPVVAAESANLMVVERTGAEWWLSPNTRLADGGYTFIDGRKSLIWRVVDGLNVPVWRATGGVHEGYRAVESRETQTAVVFQTKVNHFVAEYWRTEARPSLRKLYKFAPGKIRATQRQLKAAVKNLELESTRGAPPKRR
jgi:hypothetical protein